MNTQWNTSAMRTSEEVRRLLTEVLRQKFQETCRCYWQDMLEDTEMPINPATHSIDCPAHALQEEFEQHARAVAEEDSTPLLPTSSSPKQGGSGTSGVRSRTPRSHSTRRHRARRRSLCSAPEWVPAAHTPAKLRQKKEGNYLGAGKDRSTAHRIPGKQTVEKPDKHRRSAVFGTAKRRLPFAVPQEFTVELSSEEESPRSGSAPRQPHSVQPSPRKLRRKATPGPGAYETERADALVAPSSSAVVIGRSPRCSSPRSLCTPGPGAYNPPSAPVESQQRRVLAPSFLRSQSPRLLPFESVVVKRSNGVSEKRVRVGRDTPSLGQDDAATSPSLSATPRGVAYSFGHATVQADSKAQAEKASFPGPSDYSVSADMLGTRVSRNIVMGTSPREVVRRRSADAPGPGAYDVTPHCSGRDVSFSFRPPQRVEDTPGPGSYDVKPYFDSPADLPRSPGVVFGSSDPARALFRADVDQAPGPGHYSPERTGLLGPRNLGFSFGTTPRAVSELTGASEGGSEIGPGAYCTEAAAGPSYSFPRAPRSVGSREAADEPSPGPGAYDTPLARKGSYPNACWGTEERFASEQLREAARLPGPGTYISTATGDKTVGPAAVFGSAPRGPDCPTTEGIPPGPGAYTLPDPPKGPAFSLSFPHPAPEAADLLPGPGTYDPSDAAKTERHVRLSTTTPRFPVSSAAESAPGPGHYETPLADRGASVRFGVAPRHLLEGSEHERKEAELRGPGAYDVASTTGASARAVVITSAPRFPDVTEPTPGPGTYRWEGQGSPSSRGTIPLASRRTATPEREASQIPGPATYDPKHEVVQPAPRQVVMGSAPQLHVPPQANPALGPGSYDVPSAPLVLKGQWSFPKAERKTHPAQSTPANVGPGCYDPCEGTFDREPSTGVVMGSAPRISAVEQQASAASAVPGPGAYYPTVLQDGQYLWRSMEPGRLVGNSQQGFGSGAARLGTEAQPGRDAPGPGAYSTEVDWRDASGVPTVVFGTSQRAPPLKVSEAPGPGAYSLLLPPSGPTVSFPRADKDPSAEANPSSAVGPGSYDLPSFSLRGTPMFGFSSRFENAVHRDSVGPGQYSPSVQFVSRNDPVYSFGTATRSEKQLEGGGVDSPGPGSYVLTVPPTTNSAPHLGSGAPRMPTPAMTAQEVGPGSYDPEHPLWKSGAGYSFGTSLGAGQQPVYSEGPGPGAYAPALVSAYPSFTFPQASRVPESDQGTEPGPGQYQLPSGPHGPAVRFGTAPTARGSVNGAVSESPGPGAYDVADLRQGDHLHHGIPITTAAARPPWPEERSGAQSPGPGAYLPLPAATGTERAPVIPTAPRFEEGRQSPGTLLGPGSYDLNPQRNSVEISIPKAPRPLSAAPAMAMSPGPGQYDPLPPVGDRVAQPVDGVGFSSSAARFVEAATTYGVPGPGSYDTAVGVRSELAPRGAAFGATERFPDAAVQSPSPGPGAYDVSGSFGEFSRAAVFLGKNEPADPAAAVPGPGTYSAMGGIGAHSAAPAFTLTAKPYDAPPSTLVPGPGYYYQPPQPGEGKPAFSFPVGTAHPVEAAAADVPGPGAYYTLPGYSGEGYRFGTEAREWLQPGSSVVGPGHYSHFPLASSELGYSFGTSFRDSGSTQTAVKAQHSAAPVNSTAILERLRAAGYPVKMFPLKNFT